MSVTYRYPAQALLGDYARAGFGLVVSLGPLLFMDVASVMLWVFGGLALLFLTFAGRTALRHSTTIELDANGIAARGPLGARLDWDAVDRVRLRYFSTRKDRESGWMQLSVAGAGRRIRVDLTLDGFHEVVERVTRQAQAHQLMLDAPTLANLKALGVVAAEPA